MIDKKEIEYLKLAARYRDIFNVIDIGGFMGNWTDSVIELNTDVNVKIFEPDYNSFNFLKEKYFTNQNVEIINKGVSKKTDTLIYYKLDSGDTGVRQMSGFVMRDVYKNYNFSKIKIDVISIDTLVDYDIDFMKIDTEGFEFNVLIGCENLLSKRRIHFIQFEYGGTYQDNGMTLNDIIFYLRKFNYYVYDLNTNGELMLMENFEDDYLYNNLIATHIKL